MGEPEDKGLWALATYNQDHPDDVGTSPSREFRSGAVPPGGFSRLESDTGNVTHITLFN